MKQSIQQTLTVSAFSFLLFFCSCKKEAVPVNLNVAATSSDEISAADAPGTSKTASGYTKLVLQPGNKAGQDAWIEYSPSDPGYATHNSGSIDQFRVMAWTANGIFYEVRSLIRFTELSQIPSTSTILTAKLFLYGIDEGSVHMPEGNSYYSGSPYNQYGPNDAYVRRVTSSWDESSVTWNTIPSFTSAGQGYIPPSTTQWNYNASADVTAIVKKLVRNPSQNYGFMLSLINEDIYHSMGFYSSEYSIAKKRPKLVVVFKN